MGIHELIEFRVWIQELSEQDRGLDFGSEQWEKGRSEAFYDVLQAIDKRIEQEDSAMKEYFANSKPEEGFSYEK